MEEFLFAGLVVVLFALFIFFFFFQAKKETARIEIVNGNGKSVFVDAELADTTAKRMKGLMFRDSLGSSEGMLFVFGDEDYRKFWMMNTTIALDGIFFSSNGTVVDIIRMEPCKSLISCESYPSPAKSMYVLEVNQGFAEKNGIVVGGSKLKRTD